MPKTKKPRKARMPRGGIRGGARGNARDKQKQKQNVKVNVNIEASKGGGGMSIPMQFSNRGGESASVQRLTDTVGQLIKAKYQSEKEPTAQPVNDEISAVVDKVPAVVAKVPAKFSDVGTDTRGLKERMAAEVQSSKITDFFKPTNHNNDSLFEQMFNSAQHETNEPAENAPNYIQIAKEDDLRHQINSYSRIVSKPVRDALKKSKQISTSNVKKMSFDELQKVLSELQSSNLLSSEYLI